MSFLKTTIVGGLVFLVPIVVLGLVLDEAIGVMAVIADPVARLLPMDSLGGIAVANLLAAVVIVVVCFLAGLLARTQMARRLAEGLESAILSRIPGYVLIKGFAGTLTPDRTADLIPVIVSIDGTARIGLEVDRLHDDRRVVYFPGAPNAWSGIVEIVPPDRLERLDIPVASVFEHAERLGHGTRQLLGETHQIRQ